MPNYEIYGQTKFTNMIFWTKLNFFTWIFVVGTYCLGGLKSYNYKLNIMARPVYFPMLKRVAETLWIPNQVGFLANDG